MDELFRRMDGWMDYLEGWMTFILQLDEHIDDGLGELIRRADLAELLSEQGTSRSASGASGRRPQQLQRVGFALHPPEDPLDPRRRLFSFRFRRCQFHRCHRHRRHRLNSAGMASGMASGGAAQDKLAAGGRIGAVDVVAVIQIESIVSAADQIADAIHFDGEGKFVAEERIGRLLAGRLGPEPEAGSIRLGHLQVRQRHLDAVAHRLRAAHRQRLEL